MLIEYEVHMCLIKYLEGLVEYDLIINNIICDVSLKYCKFTKRNICITTVIEFHYNL